MEFDKIDCIVFDLGGVIVDLDSRKTFEALASYSTKELEYDALANHSVFHEFERGLLEPEDFLKKLSELIEADIDYQILIDSWNAMILDVPSERLELLASIKKQIPIYSFSNTNVLHIEYLDNLLLNRYGLASMAEPFNEAFYSHKIGHRKPDMESYQCIVRKGEMEHKNVLFLDDNIDNIQAAEQAGFTCWHINSPHQWIEHFSEWTN